MRSKIISSPLNRLSWSTKAKKSKIEKLVESTALEWYEAKHRNTSKEETEFINSLTILTCPYCGSSHIVKAGKASNSIQMYLCHECHKRFRPLTGTIFDSKKIPISEWIEYLIHLFEYHSIKTTAFDNRNAISTGRFWLKKVFLVLEDYQDNILLKSRVYIDEKFFSVAQKDKITKDGKKLRGISPNQICVASGTDGKQVFFIVTKYAKLTEKAALKVYGMHIEKGSILIHDKEKAHNIVVEQLGLKSIAYDSEQLKGLRDNENPLYKINRQHFLVNKFMSIHDGYDRNELQAWLNLFCFIQNTKGDKFDKVLKFIELAVKTRKNITFRERFCKKHL